MDGKVVGQTKSAGFQVGVRRTFPITQEEAWRLIISENGIGLWLGESTDIVLEPGCRYTAKNDEGMVRIVKPLLQLRLTWKKAIWKKASTIQIRIIPKETMKTTISFHQENLPDQMVREEMKQHWERVLEELKNLI